LEDWKQSFPVCIPERSSGTRESRMSVAGQWFWFIAGLVANGLLVVAFVGFVNGRFYFIPYSTLRGNVAKFANALAAIPILMVVYVAMKVVSHP
jgi:hypothetical protein